MTGAAPEQLLFADCLAQRCGDAIGPGPTATIRFRPLTTSRAILDRRLGSAVHKAAGSNAGVLAEIPPPDRSPDMPNRSPRLPTHARVKGVAKPIAPQVDRHYRYQDHRARENEPTAPGSSGLGPEEACRPSRRSGMDAQPRKLRRLLG